MSAKDTLGDRMKTYERVTKQHLMRRTPVIIRLDGKAFHTFTKRITKQDPYIASSNTPFSVIMHDCMHATAHILASKIQNAVLVYTQSDEISILLVDWERYETQQWYDGNLQKLTSVSASIATAAFNWALREHIDQEQFSDFALFDSRAFNLPIAEVCNYFIWRQQDASRNSVQMLGHHHFSQREMHGKNNSEVQDMLMLSKNINWNDIPTWAKRGSCVYVNEGCLLDDQEIPIFSQDRQYIERHICGGE